MSYDFSSMNILKSALPMLKTKPEMLRRKSAMEEMGAAYMANGIVTLAGSRLYTSMADTDEIIDGLLRDLTMSSRTSRFAPQTGFRKEIIKN